MNPTIDIAVADGSFSAYLARPSSSAATGPADGRGRPALIVLQEIFGVNAGIRSIAAEMAAQGFIVLCPDLFWRSERGLDMRESDPAHQERGFALYRAYDLESGVRDIAATAAAARALPGCSGKVGVMGYCLGGLLTFLAATEGGIADAAVAYYGGGTERFLARAPAVAAPLLMHLAEDDEYIGKQAQAAIHAALDGRAGVTIHAYPGQSHAFARPGGAHYDAASALLANHRTLAFLRQHLL